MTSRDLLLSLCFPFRLFVSQLGFHDFSDGGGDDDSKSAEKRTNSLNNFNVHSEASTSAWSGPSGALNIGRATNFHRRNLSNADAVSKKLVNLGTTYLVAKSSQVVA